VNAARWPRERADALLRRRAFARVPSGRSLLRVVERRIGWIIGYVSARRSRRMPLKRPPVSHVPRAGRRNNATQRANEPC